MAPLKPIQLNALRLRQRSDVPIYVFGIDGRLVRQVASISFAERKKDGALSGYQRGPAEKHIREILEYLSSKEALLPNAIVVAFDERVKFVPIAGATPSEWGTFGQLSIPVPANGSEARAGWIVDGQQRATALAKLPPSKQFPVVVVAFQSKSQELQRNQFVLVNKTKPLPRNLLNEILPEVDAPLPKTLERHQLASRVLVQLRFDTSSPFFGRIRGLGGDTEACNISQNALIEVVQNSMRKKGVLFAQYNPQSKSASYARMASLLSAFYEGARRTWPAAWEGSPSSSRLVHGVGIVALGHLMDRIMVGVDPGDSKAASFARSQLVVVAKRCAWTAGKWPSLGLEWNGLQNTSQDKTALADYLLREYERLK
jgi:DGQHR domain-containing protein